MSLSELLAEARSERITVRLFETPQAAGGARRYVGIEGRPAGLRLLASVLESAARTAEESNGGYHAVLDPVDVAQLEIHGADALQIDVLRETP